MKDARLFLTADRFDAVVLPKISGSERVRPVVIPLHLRFDAKLTVIIAKQDAGLRYAYTLSIGTAAKDVLLGVILAESPKVARGAVSFEPSNAWSGGATSGLFIPEVELRGQPRMGSASWSINELDPNVNSIHPGETIRGFHIQTNVLPGLSTAYLSGVQMQVPPDDNTSDGSEYKGVELDALLENWAIRDYSVLTLAPMFGPETSLKIVAENYLAGLRRLQDCSNPDQTGFLKWMESTISATTDRAILLQKLQHPVAEPATDLEKQILFGLQRTLETLR